MQLATDASGRAMGRTTHDIDFNLFTTLDGWRVSWASSTRDVDGRYLIDFRTASTWRHEPTGVPGGPLTDEHAYAIALSHISRSAVVNRVLPRYFSWARRRYILPSGHVIELP